MSWDYAELSRMAKEAGGPDLLLNTLETNAREQGRIEGAGIGAIVAGSLFAGAALIYRQYNKKRALANEAKLELEKGIESFEAASERAEAGCMECESAESDPYEGEVQIIGEEDENDSDDGQ